LHLGTAALLEFYSRHRDDDALVLATITSTEGSTYRKPGAMMLIASDDTYEGLISGGCLEGDLLAHAAEVFSQGKPKRVVYDMHSDEDLVWGLGIGCDGIIELLLTRLNHDQHNELLGGISRSLDRRNPVCLALVTESNDPPLPVGSLAALDESGRKMGHETLLQLMVAINDWPDGRYSQVNRAGVEFSLVNLEPRPRLLLCGGGPDARPLAQQAGLLGWDCVVVDHRATYACAERFPAKTEVILCRPEALQEMVTLTEVDAAVIMSHHLESDAKYLQQLAPIAEQGALRYLGVLGPVARRNRLREMAECPDVLVHGPVGLDIGAELPEAIALSVAAEIHAVLNQRDGQSLTTGPVGDVS